MSAVAEAARLAAVLDRLGPLAVAVRGGVDSMTLATFAHRRAPEAISVVHAVSPAVPAEATRRVRAAAAAEGWRLTVADAGEFDDQRYRANPADRCYFCKTNLYNRIRWLSARRIASGTNLDDMGDYRPGLTAAAEHDVVHPYVEAGIAKEAVRRLARDLGLGEVAELPAQPCLASRVETGIAIDAEDLALVAQVETQLAAMAPQQATLRCRITMAGVAIEVGPEAAGLAAALAERAGAMCAARGRPFAGVRPYRRGGMFVRS
jgi:uncharacterized protein